MSTFRLEDHEIDVTETDVAPAPRGKVQEGVTFCIMALLTAVAVSGMIWALAAVGRAILSQ